MKDGGRWKILLESLRFLQNLCAWAVDFNYFTNLGYVNKLVYQPLAINFSQNAPLVVVPQSTSHSFIVHVWLVFVHAPAPGDSLRVHKFKDAFFSVCPFDGSGASFFVLQQFEKELPEVSGGALTGFSLHWNAIRADLRLASFFLQLMEGSEWRIGPSLTSVNILFGWPRWTEALTPLAWGAGWRWGWQWL